MNISEIRKQYPQYGDLSDQQLADSLHGKFYADMPKEEFYAKVGLAKQHGVVDAFKGAFASAARGLNEASAGVLDKMSKGAKFVERVTGLPAGGAFEAGANTSRANTEFWRGKETEAGVNPDAITTKVYTGVGRAPIDIAEFSAGTPTAALSGLTEGGPLEALRAGAVRYGVGRVFKGLEKANLSPVQRSGAMAGTMAAQTAAEGGTVEDVVAAGLTGLALSSPTEGGRAGRVRQNLQRAGVQPETAHDLASRPEVMPRGMGSIDTTSVDRALPGETAPRPLVMDAEAAPRAVTVRPAERTPVLDAENPSRITRDPMIPGGPGDAASIEAARLRIEHPDWKDADVWETAQRNVLADVERVPTPTERDAQPVRREPVATAEDAPRPSPLNPPSMENPPVFNHDSLPTAAVTAADSLSVPPSVKVAVVGTPAEISALVQPGKAVLRNGDKAYLIDRAEAAKQFGSLAEAKKMLLAGGDAEAKVLGYPSRPEGVPLTTEAVTKSGEILTEPDAIKQAASAGEVAYAAESTPAEVRAATERVADSLLTEPSASGTVSPSKGGGGMGKAADVTRLEEKAADKGVLTTENRGEYERLSQAAAELDGSPDVKLQHSAEAIQYLNEKNFTDPYGFTTPYTPPDLYARKKEVYDLAGVPLAPPDRIYWRDMTPEQKKSAVQALDPSKTFTPREIEILAERVGYWSMDATPRPMTLEVQSEQKADTTAGEAGVSEQGVPEVQEVASPAGDGVPVLQPASKGGDVNGQEGRQEVLGGTDPDAVTLLHAGVHIPTLVKQVYDKYFRKLDADAAPGSVKEFLDKNREANRKWGTEPVMRWLRRAGIDQAANAQMELMRIGTPGEWARREFDAISGATAKSALVKERFREDAMAGMSLRERQAMSDLVAIERDLAIAASGKTGYTFIGGKTPLELHTALTDFQRDYKLSNAEMQRVRQATDKYFQAWKDRTQRMLDTGLIDAREKADLDAHLYSPKQFLDKIDPFVSIPGGGAGGRISVPDSGIHRLKEGSDAYFRNDPVALLEEAIDRTETRIARNEANRALAALPAGNGITEPAVRIGAKDWAEPPAGYETIRYMENGKQQAINVREDFAREWAQADPLVNSQLVNAIGWLSGASAVRAGSTGHNPLFAIANFPVDAMTIFLQADKRGYSPHAPVAVAQMARNVASVAKDAWKHEGRYADWVNEKGAREMLSNYGGITSRRAHLSPLMQKVSDVTSKIGRFSEEVSRLAYREQLIKNGVAPAEASKIAGEYVDFSRGGSILKAVDRLGLPYLNAGVQGTRSVARAAGRDPAAFAYKAAQLLVGASALYGINQMVNPTGWANVSDREKADNFIIMLPSYFNYTDKDGTTVTPYIRIKKEQSVRPLLSMAEALWQMTHEGKDATQQVEMAFDGAVPISPDKLLPPVAKMYLAYAANLDVYRKENVWKGKQEIEPYAEYTNNTNPILTRIGKETQVGGKGGVSPERLGRAVGQVIVPSNLFAKTGGALLTSAYEKMNPQERAEFGKTNYEKLVEFMKGTRLLGGAKDTEQFREGIRESRVATNTQLFEMNKPLDAMVLKYAKEGMKDQAQYDKILSYIDSQPPEHQDRLESRMEDVIETANLPDRGWWLAVKALSPEDRADQFKARLEKVDPAEQERMMQIAEGLSGFTSERFWERYDGSAQAEDVR